jgi:outer membrane receptor protein involved in Fe transport
LLIPFFFARRKPANNTLYLKGLAVSEKNVTQFLLKISIRTSITELTYFDGQCKQLSNIMFIKEKLRLMAALNMVLVATAGIGTTLLSQPAYAVSEDRLELQTYEVTGSRIPRADTEGLAPLALFDREILDRSGAATVNDFLRDMVFNSAGTYDEQFTQGFAPGTSSIDLRGMGVNRTLVLLDGRRLPVYPFGHEGTQSFVDINAIPLAAIERIEVLKDGASAIYGADAVAGVVNIITRKDMDGAEGSIQLGTTSEGDGEEVRLNAVAGKHWEQTSGTLVVDYFNRQAVMAKDREISSSANGPIDDRSFLGNPGTWIPLSGPTAGLPQADVNCPAERIITSGPASFCSYDFAPWATLIPETERLGLSGNLDHHLGDGMRLFARAMFSRSYSERDLAPTNNAPDLFFVPGADLNNPLGEDMVVLYRMEELGPRRDEFDIDSYNVLAGIGGYAGSWDWEAAVGYGRVDAKITGVKGYASLDDLQAAVFDGTLNLFGDSPNFDADSVSYTTGREGESKHYFADVKATGELFEMDSGTVQMAVGAEVRREEFSDKWDEQTESGAILGICGVSAEGDRNLKSAYAELSVPAMEELELQLAGRYDHYSDFGGTFNPKLGLRWQPRSDFLLRASAGTGFKAPALHELYSGDIDSFESLIDGGNLVSDIPTTITGNPNLEAEESRSLNLGFVWDITSNWDLGVDGWWLKNENAVSNDPQYIPDNEDQYADLIERDASGDLVSLTSPFQNIAAQKLLGLDIDTHVNWRTEHAGRFRFGVLASYLGSFKQEAVEGDGFESLTGKDGRPRLRGQATLSWKRAAYGANLTANHTGGYDRPAVDDSIDSWTTLDAQFNWTPQELKSGTVTLGVKNLLNEEPPEDPYFEGWPFINRALHNPRGRFIYLGYKHKL